MIALAGLATVAMARSWQRRVARDAQYHAAPVPAELGTAVVDTEVLYVATTVAESLERLALNGLKFRGYAAFTVVPEGVVIAVSGESPVLIPAARITGVGTASHTIDRGVGKDGLVAITWRALGTDEPVVDTYVRALDADNSALILGAIQNLIADASGAAITTGERAVE